MPRKFYFFTDHQTSLQAPYWPINPNTGHRTSLRTVPNTGNFKLNSIINQLTELECLPGWNQIALQMNASWRKNCSELKSLKDRNCDEHYALSLLDRILNARTEQHGETLLIYAARNNHNGLVTALLKRSDTDVYATRLSDGLDALKIAEYQTRDLIQDRINHVTIPPVSQLESMHHQVIKQVYLLEGIEELQGWNELVQLMGGGKWLDKFFMLREWAKSSIHDKCKDSSNAYSKFKAFSSCFDSEDHPLIFAAHRGYKDLVARLRFLPQINNNATDKEQRTALMRAAINRNTEITELLLNTIKIDTNKKDKNGCTALMLAVKSGDSDSVTLLLQVLEIDIHATNNEGLTALAIAKNNNNIECIKLLSEKSGRNLHTEINSRPFWKTSNNSFGTEQKMAQGNSCP